MCDLSAHLLIVRWHSSVALDVICLYGGRYLDRFSQVVSHNERNLFPRILTIQYVITAHQLTK